MNYKRGKTAGILMFLSIILIAVFITALNLGKYPIKPCETVGMILKKPLQWIHIDAWWTRKQEVIFFNVRLPRILLSMLVGCCLSAAGVSYQGVFHNPMAAPDVLGASAGAAFGAALAILQHGSSFTITMYAFAFSMLSVAVVYLLGKQIRGNKITGLLLSGIMVGSLFQSMTSYIKLVADPDEQLPAITFWLMGSFSATKMSEVRFVLIPIIIGIIPLFLIRWRINLLTLSEDEARSMGVNMKHLRFLVIICATLITAASVSVSGIIGFVGMIIPNLVRRFAGNNYQLLLPASMLTGAIFLLLVDTIARTVSTAELPIGILSSFVGCPFFIYLFSKEGKL